MRKIKNIFWDIGAVLFSEAQISKKEFKPVLSMLGMSADESDEIFDSLWVDYVRPGKMSEDEYWKHYLDASKRKPKLESIKKIYRDCIWVNQELLDLAKLLSNRYNQYILTNHGSEWTRYLVDQFNLKKYFKEIYSSGWMGIAKPSKEFFEYVLKGSQVDPRQTLYIDDNAKNILAAGKFGIIGLVYKDNELLKKQLKKLEIV